MKKLIIFLVLISSICSAQTEPHWLDLRGKPCFDLREFRAKATPGFDNAAALASAAALINARGGNCTLVIPAGTFEVIPGGPATDRDSSVMWSPFTLTNADNVTIVGETGAKITSSLNMGSPTTDGQSMWLFEFNNCNNITLDNLIVDIAITAASDTILDPEDCELAAIVKTQVASESISGLAVKNCDLKINNAINGNGAKAGYEFTTIFIRGDWTSPYTFSYSGVDIENNIFRDGQGPELWFWFVRGFSVKGNRWADSGGPLNPIRMYPSCADGTVFNNSFTMKHQPGQSSATNHPYPITIDGGSGGATNDTLAIKDISIVNNSFVTLSSQMAVINGGKNIKVIGNTVTRPAGSVGVGFTGSIAIGKSGFGENVEDILIGGNSFRGLNDSCIAVIGSPTSVIISNNTFATCTRALLTNQLSLPISLVFSGNSIRECSGEAIYIGSINTAQSKISITNNTFLSNQTACLFTVYASGNDYTISGNTFINNGIATDTPVLACRGGSFAITGNKMRANVSSADIETSTLSSSPFGSVVSGNIIEGSHRNAISVAGKYQNIAGNLIINPSQGLIASDSAILVATGSSVINIAANTLISAGPTKAGVMISISSATASLVSGNLFSTSSTYIASGSAGVTTINNY